MQRSCLAQAPAPSVTTPQVMALPWNPETQSTFSSLSYVVSYFVATRWKVTTSPVVWLIAAKNSSLTSWSKDSKLGLVKQSVSSGYLQSMGEELLTGARTTQRQLCHQKIHSSMVNTDTAAMGTSDQKQNMKTSSYTPSSSHYLHSHEIFSKWGGDWDEGLLENPFQFGGLPSDWFLPFTYFS